MTQNSIGFSALHSVHFPAGLPKKTGGQIKQAIVQQLGRGMKEIKGEEVLVGFTDNAVRVSTGAEYHDDTINEHVRQKLLGVLDKFNDDVPDIEYRIHCGHFYSPKENKTRLLIPSVTTGRPAFVETYNPNNGKLKKFEFAGL